MKQEELMRLLPHRDNMLLIDEAEVADGVARGRKTIRGDEWFLKGHFPGNPVVPGVILCEILGQSACVLLAENEAEGATPYFTSLDNVRFKAPVKPGDTVETECRITKSKASFYFLSGKATVNGKVCVTADFSFALVRG